MDESKKIKVEVDGLFWIYVVLALQCLILYGILCYLAVLVK